MLNIYSMEYSPELIKSARAEIDGRPRKLKVFRKIDGEYVINPIVEQALKSTPKKVLTIDDRLAWNKKKKELLPLYRGDSKRLSKEFNSIKKKSDVILFGTKLYDGLRNKVIEKKDMFKKDGQLRKAFINTKVIGKQRIIRKKEKKKADKTYSVSFTMTYDTVFKKDPTKSYKESETKTFILNAGEIMDSKIQSIMNAWEEDPPSPVLSYSNIKASGISKTEIQATEAPTMTFINNVAPNIDGINMDTSWDTKQYRCVYDWLIHYYPTKNFTYEKLFDIFNDDIDFNFLTEDKFNALEKGLLVGDMADIMVDQMGEILKWTYVNYCKSFWGVSPDMLTNRFAKKYGIPHYCLDQNENYIEAYVPDNHNGHSKGMRALCYTFTNGHLYPITCPNKVKSVADKKRASNTIRGVDKKEDSEPKKYEIETLTDTDPYKHIFTKMTETDTIVIGKNIVLDGATIKSYVLGDTKYVFNNSQADELGKKYMGDGWNGETLTGIVSKIVREYMKEKNIQSTPNHSVNNILKSEGIKWRTHLGLIDNEVNIEETDKALDINKCYRACIENPTEPFMKLDFNSLPKNFKDQEIVLGLYYVETDDITLFHHTNLYSSAIVKLGLDEGIIRRDDIEWFIPAISVGNPFPELIELMKANTIDYGCDLCDKKIPTMSCYYGGTAEGGLCKKCWTDCLIKNEIDELEDMDEIKWVANNGYEEDEGLTKAMINYITGMIGKDNYTRTHVNISTDIKECFNYVKNQSERCFIKPNEDKTLYLYGIKNSKELAEHNLPIYLQILDQSNIRLYNLIKAVEAKPIYRKTDMVVFRDLIGDIKTDKKVGGIKWEELPSTIFLNKYDQRYVVIEQPDINPDINFDKVINSSSQYEAVLESLTKHNGCMMIGDAGTGKSYVIDKIAEKVGVDSVARICFTNKGAININGTTIHKFLQLDSDSKMNSKRITTIKNSIKYILVDEISMIGKDLWRILTHLHYLTDIPFLLVGDDKQLPPVEDCKMDYFNHPAIIKLVHNNFIRLTEIQRYDNELKKLSNNVMKLNPKKFPSNVADKNICYTNKTRVLVNGYLNNHKIKKIAEADREYIDNKIKIDDKKTDDIKDPTQPFWLYNGLPMIARITKGDEQVNNEEFIVMEFNDIEVMLMSERPEGTHIISIKRSLLVHRFLVAYCITTHKAQGSTIDEPVTIWDWEKMDIKLRYTAITRVRKASQLNFHSV